MGFQLQHEITSGTMVQRQCESQKFDLWEAVAQLETEMRNGGSTLVTVTDENGNEQVSAKRRQSSFQVGSSEVHLSFHIDYISTSKMAQDLRSLGQETYRPAPKGVRQKESGKKVTKRVTKKVTKASAKVTERVPKGKK